MIPASDPEEAFAAAYDKYAEPIFRHCYFRTFNRERGKELMQETFMRVWEYIQKGHDIETEQAFLYRTANNLIIDEARRRSKRKEESLEALQEEGFDIGTDEDEQTMQRKVDERNVLSIIRKIDQPYRDTLILRFVDGLTPAEITGESANVISVRLNRGLKKLRTLLKQ
ncbi:MAG: RNA polymerase sigma factor [Candidatus Peregrinibacteria bacterium]|nr:RNA polymerase sigma factor [Candidatus Peregrinibacteria bacterium]